MNHAAVAATPIDGLVYDLYGLTVDEIKIVENIRQKQAPLNRTHSKRSRVNLRRF